MSTRFYISEVSFVNNPVPLRIYVDGEQDITVQILLDENIFFEADYTIRESIRIDISDILRTFVFCKEPSLDFSEMDYSFDCGQQIRPYQIKLLDDTGTQLAQQSLYAVYGGVPSRLIQNDFISDVVGNGMLVLSTRAYGKFYFMRETEVGLLRILTPINEFRIVSPGRNIYPIKNSNPDTNYKICSIDLTYIRYFFFTEYGEFPAYFSFIADGAFAFQVAFTPGNYTADKQILEFRNSLGGYERIEITGKQELSLEYEEDDSAELTVWDDHLMDYQLSTNRKKSYTLITANAGFKNKYELLFIQDLLSSPDIRLVSETSKPKVIVSSEEYKVPLSDSEPGSITLKIKYADADSNYMPEEDTYLPQERVGEWFLQQGKINSLGLIYAASTIKTV